MNKVQQIIQQVVGQVAALRPYRKAIGGFLTPGVVALGLALLPGSDGGSAITSAEWSGVAAASLATAGIVWRVRNTPKSN